MTRPILPWNLKPLNLATHCKEMFSLNKRNFPTTRISVFPSEIIWNIYLEFFIHKYKNYSALYILKLMESRLQILMSWTIIHDRGIQVVISLLCVGDQVWFSAVKLYKYDSKEIS